MILGEFIGISFEQMRFLAENRISVSTSMFIHVLAAPKFLVMTLPYALLMANIFTYKELSKSSEIIALCSFGTTIYQLVIPSIGLSLILASLSFYCQELIVTKANYRAAIILEQAMNIDRGTTTNHDFIYSEFNKNGDGKHLELLLYAKQTHIEVMDEVTLLTFDRGNIQKIIIARAAYWNPKDKIWSLVKGIEKKIDNARQLILNPFETYSFKLGQTLNQILIQARDNNELRIFELRRKIETFQQTGHDKEVHQIESDIQQRLIMPFSCMTFSFVGAAIGINLKPKSSENEFSLGLLIILTYYVFQSICTTLVAKDSLPLWGMWIPVFSGVGFALTKLARFA